MANIKNKTLTLVLKKSTNFILLAFIIIVAFLYVCFAGVAVRTLTILEKSKVEMQSLSIEVSEMESKRLALENEVDLEKALALGFIEVNHQTFIIKENKKTALSLNVE
ncbi:MAG: hypothetical protein JW740_03290 [Candidatus Zambryskibacteria bacterium]|nr:hypothetical protein [Candidatus Zambryskibacteria bacterium]